MVKAVTIDKLPVEVFEQYAQRRDLVDGEKIFGVGSIDHRVARDVETHGERQDIPHLAQLRGIDQKTTVAFFPKWKGEKRRMGTQSLGGDEKLKELAERFEWAEVVWKDRQDKDGVRFRQIGMQAG